MTACLKISCLNARNSCQPIMVTNETELKGCWNNARLCLVVKHEKIGTLASADGIKIKIRFKYWSFIVAEAGKTDLRIQLCI